MASDAFPDVIDQSPLVVDEDNNGKFMNSSTSPSPSSDAAVVVTPIEETPPAEGDTRWGGSRLPSPGDPYMVYQMDCYNKTGFEGIPSLLVMYGLPRGWSGSLSTGTWGMFMWAVDEDWDVTVRPPGDYSQISFKVKADLAEKLKSDWGGETAVGTAPWPLVAEKYSNGVWNILKPVQCQWPN
ncbi:MAG TPA: hypothetical protein PK639_03245 [Candidatus Woesebacteria bacterium]|nr:hypothetical protein [Candidatus Woesebacteria bacterium]